MSLEECLIIRSFHIPKPSSGNVGAILNGTDLPFDPAQRQGTASSDKETALNLRRKPQLSKRKRQELQQRYERNSIKRHKLKPTALHFHSTNSPHGILTLNGSHNKRRSLFNESKNITINFIFRIPIHSPSFACFQQLQLSFFNKWQTCQYLLSALIRRIAIIVSDIRLDEAV